MLEKNIKENPKKDKIMKAVSEMMSDPFDHDEITVTFNIPGKPENYVRERTGRNHFYTPKTDIRQKCRIECIRQLGKETHDRIKKLIAENNDAYTVYLDVSYYYPIPLGDSIAVAAMKEAGYINPTVRIDLDNYDKFLLDALHEVIYDDDKHVISINSRKLFSLTPRTVVTATIRRNILKK